MKFAILGDDPRCLGVVSAIAADPRHSVTDLALTGELLAQLRELTPQARVLSNEEDLLAEGGPDAVVVCGATEIILQTARQLAGAGKPLLVCPAPRQTSTFAYEMTLLQAEQQVTLFPLSPLRGHPCVQRLRELLDARELGNVHHIRLEREIPSEVSAGSPVMSRDDFSRALLDDIDLFRCLSGEYDQVLASRSETAPGEISLATVTLTGSQAPQAVWSATAGSPARWRLTVTAERGTAVLAGDPDQGVLTLTGRKGAAGEPIDEAATSTGGAWLLERFQESLDQRGLRPNWTDYTRGFELLDGVERSLRRRRTIDLNFEVPSERSTFKTQMTAIGCSLLVLTLLATVLYLIVAAAVNLNDTVKYIARAVIFLPLGLFLLLQLFLLLTRPSTES